MIIHNYPFKDENQSLPISRPPGGTPPRGLMGMGPTTLPSETEACVGGPLLNATASACSQHRREASRRQPALAKGTDEGVALRLHLKAIVLLQGGPEHVVVEGQRWPQGTKRCTSVPQKGRPAHACASRHSVCRTPCLLAPPPQDVVA